MQCRLLWMPQARRHCVCRRRDPVSVKALTKKSRVDLGFRQEMYRLLVKRHEERVGGGRDEA